MSLFSYVKEAMESLVSNKMRTFLTMLGIVIGVAAVISMLSIGEGASASITSSIESMGTNVIYVFRDNSVANSQALTISDANALSEIKSNNFSAVAPLVSDNREVSFSGNSITAQIYGITPEYATVRNENVNYGSFITETQVENRSTVAVIGVDIADELYGTTSNIIGNKIRIGNYLYTVIGVLESKGGTTLGSSDNQIFVPITTAQSRLISWSSTKDAVDQIYVSATNTDTIDAAINEITSVLKSRHGIPLTNDADFQLFSQETLTEAATSITQILTIFLGGIGAISLLVGGIGIMNIMLVTVVERTKEIGLRKAVGARKKDILTQFLVESLFIGLVGGIIGILLGAGISAIIKSVASMGNTVLNPVITSGSVLLATLFSVGVGLLFGIYPANRAANLEPVEALRTE
ncbi:MAG: FtsX-like permease family protein [Chloroflexi bacterium]|jgi:putative ABC transport system permease protein|nr:FtsX-like permease family protein [Chloroflexota bacterium]